MSSDDVMHEDTLLVSSEFDSGVIQWILKCLKKCPW